MQESRYSLRPRRAFAAELPPLTTNPAAPLTDLTTSPLTPLGPSSSTPCFSPQSTSVPNHIRYPKSAPTSSPATLLGISPSIPFYSSPTPSVASHARYPISHPESSIPPFFTLEARVNPGIWGSRIIFYPHMTSEAGAALVFNAQTGAQYCPIPPTSDPSPSIQAFWNNTIDHSLRLNIPRYPHIADGSFDAFLALLRDIALPGDLRNDRLSLPSQMAVLATLRLGEHQCRLFEREIGMYYRAHQEELDVQALAAWEKSQEEREEQARMREDIYYVLDEMDWGSEVGEFVMEG